MAADADSAEAELTDDGTTAAPVTTDTAEVDSPDESEEEPTEGSAEGGRTPVSPLRLALLAGIAVLVAAVGLTGYLGYRSYQAQQSEDRHDSYLQAARQGAINLTTIDWTHADADIQRILDSATGTFHDEFTRNAQPFVDVVKNAQSTSVGSVTEAGVESESTDGARVLVAVSVKTSNAGGGDADPRKWRMRIDVQQLGDQIKVSNVQFVP